MRKCILDFQNEAGDGVQETEFCQSSMPIANNLKKKPKTHNNNTENLENKTVYMEINSGTIRKSNCLYTVQTKVEKNYSVT